MGPVLGTLTRTTYAPWRPCDSCAFADVTTDELKSRLVAALAAL